MKEAKSFPKWIQISWLVALLAVPIVLWILPESYFDTGRSLCPSQRFFGLECFGCGATRSVMHLHHFNIEESLFFHSLGPFIYLFLIFLWLRWTYYTSTRLGLWGEQRAQKVEAQLRDEKVHQLAQRAKRKNLN